MAQVPMEQALSDLRARAVPGGGFASLPGGAPRADAVCWAIVALRAAGDAEDLVQAGQESLARMQQANGSVCISSKLTEVFWPTALAVLAWHGSAEHETARQRAVQFLIECEQVYVATEDVHVTGQDETIRGWPWTGQTHSWVEPTAYALMALRVSGRTQHGRVSDGVRLLLDRQIRGGGWNFGNTSVLGQELHPMPETTGIALEALAGVVSKATVEGSIAHLKSELESLNAPMSLAWRILGLAAWGEATEHRQEHILRILGRQDDYGPYDTESLSLLLLAWYCEAGLLSFLRASAAEGNL